MSLWGVHIGFAAIVTTLVLARVDLSRAKRWSIIFTSGVWAVVPDFHWLFPSVRVWYKPLVHDSMLANLFWLHRVIDRTDPRDRPLYSVATVVLFVLVFLAVEHRRDDGFGPLR